MMRAITMMACAAVTASLASVPLAAQTGTTASSEFTLQGKLTTMNGGAVANGSHTLTIKVYARGSGEMIYSEMDNVTTTEGMFSTMIGDNGSGTGGTKLMVEASTQYDIGISVDGQNEMSPRLQIGSAPKAATSDVALNAMAIGGLRLMNDTNRFNAIVTTNAQGRLGSGLLDTSSMVTSINGLHGSLNFKGGGNLNVDTTGGMVTFSYNGSGGSFNLPYMQTLNLGAGQTGFSLTNGGAGSVASFANTGAGGALDLQATSGPAINATSSSSGMGTINVTNSGGAAIHAVGNASTGAVLQLQNTSSNAQGNLISAMDASSNIAFNVMSSGRTTIRSSVGNALDVSTSAAGEAALKVTGGLTLTGPVGTGTVDLTNGSTTISNAYVKPNSIIMITATSATNAAMAVPLRISSQGNGTFTVSAITGTLGSLTGSLSFNYLIINQ